MIVKEATVYNWYLPATCSQWQLHTKHTASGCGKLFHLETYLMKASFPGELIWLIKTTWLELPQWVHCATDWPHTAEHHDNESILNDHLVELRKPLALRGGGAHPCWTNSFFHTNCAYTWPLKCIFFIRRFSCLARLLKLFITQSWLNSLSLSLRLLIKQVLICFPICFTSLPPDWWCAVAWREKQSIGWAYQLLWRHWVVPTPFICCDWCVHPAGGLLCPSCWNPTEERPPHSKTPTTIQPIFTDRQKKRSRHTIVHAYSHTPQKATLWLRLSLITSSQLPPVCLIVAG